MATEYNEVATPGGRIGARVTRLLTDAILATRKDLASVTAQVGQQIFADATNHVAAEVQSVMGRTFQGLADHPDMDDELRPLFTHLAQTRGQAFGWLGGAATGAAVGGSVGRLMDNMLNPVVSALISVSPALNLEPGLSASAAARGILTLEEGRREIRFGGLGKGREDTLIALARRPFTPTEVMELLNRGQIQHGAAIAFLQDNGMTAETAELLITLSRLPLSPEQAAAGWARSLVPEEKVVSAAHAAGMSAEDAKVLMGLAGEPPSTEALITAWRRGIITEQDFDRGIIQGPIRNEWIPVVKALLELPLTPEEAANAVTQGHLSETEGAARARLSGVSEADFKVIVANSGLPPGLEFASEAYNRGLLSESDWTRMFLESRIKNEWLPLMRLMRQNLIPTETARMMYRQGVYSREDLARNLAGHGFSTEDANAQIALEDSRRGEATKDLTRAQILELYRDDIVSKADAEKMVRDLGFDEQETQWQLSIVEVDKVRSLVNAAVTRVRSAYVNAMVDEAEATQLLDEIGVSPGRRDNLLRLWDLERETIRSSLTVAQIQSALRKGYIDSTGAYRRFLGRGFAREDANILVRLAGGEEQQGEEE